MKYFIVAGEASGDLHASNLMKELKNVDAEAEFMFLGGDLMLSQGGSIIKHYRQMAFMGFITVLRNARTVLNNLSDCKKAILNFQPDVVILVDYPSFNLKIARFVKENLKTPVYYYISPKIWAWKEYRIKQIKKYVDKMFTILPFETDFYDKHNFTVEYVGNPSVDSVYDSKPQYPDLNAFCKANNLPEKPIIAVLAGSRKQEIEKCLPRMYYAAESFKDFQVVVAQSPGIEADFYKKTLDKEYGLVLGQTYELLRHSRVAIVNSGTATLETALLGTPQIVVYHVVLGKVGYRIKNLLIKVKYISLVNLIAEKEVVKELIAHLFTSNNIRVELPSLLFDATSRKKMTDGYGLVKERLGKEGTARNAAEKIVDYLTEK